MTTTHDAIVSAAPASPVELARRRGAVGKLVATDTGLDGLILRWTLALVIFPHGAQKLLGWFGGPGWDGAMGMLTGSMGLPALVAALVILIEFFAPLALVVGVGTRIAAAAIAMVMVGAVLTAHLPNGFFMNWSGQKAGEGFEFHILALGICAALLAVGAGRRSVDRTTTERLAAAEARASR